MSTNLKRYRCHLTITLLAANAADAIRLLTSDAAKLSPANEMNVQGLEAHQMEDYEVTGLSSPTTGPSYPTPEVPLGAPEPVQAPPAPSEEAQDSQEEPCEGCGGPVEPGMPLPADTPYIGTLTKAGETLDTLILKAQSGGLGSIKGMGTAGVAKVMTYLIDTGRISAANTPGNVNAEKKPAAAATAPTPQAPAEDDVSSLLGEQPAAPSLPKVDGVTVKKALADVARAKGVPALKKILQDFGAAGLGEVSEEQYPAIYAAAQKALA